MPERNSTSRKQLAGTTTLRRSPRFLPNSSTKAEDLKTPDFKSRTNRISSSACPSLTSLRKGSLKATREPFSEKGSRKLKDSKSGSKISEKLKTSSKRSATLNCGVCLRRSTRFSGNQNTCGEFFQSGRPCKCKTGHLANAKRAEGSIDPHKDVQAKIEKRVTRSSSRGSPDGCVKKTNKNRCNGSTESVSFHCSCKNGLPGAERTKAAVCSFQLDRRVTRKSRVGDDNRIEFTENCSELVEEEDSSEVERVEVRPNSCKKEGGKLEKRRTSGFGPTPPAYGENKEEERDIDEGMEVVGVKRKRNEVEKGDHGTVQDWAEDQELALQRAYFAVKPTPHFWKKVAKLVPGKSARDCFDKVHSDHLTPPQPRTRSRAGKSGPSSFSLSASTLLKSAEPKPKRPSGQIRKSHLALRTVRQLLEKQYNMDQNGEADLFSVLEPTFCSSSQASHQGVAPSTPKHEQQKYGYLKKCPGRSSAANKKRLSDSQGTTLVSPPVLKQVKSMALHEKYIDLLHFREAKRKAALAQAAKFMPGKENREAGYVRKMDTIKAAKNALVFDAKEVIHQFQHLKASPVSNSSDFDDDNESQDEY